jgi:hypothetical protein
MDEGPTAQWLWRIKTATVERHVVVAESRTSMSFRMDEITTVAVIDVAAAIPASTCIDLELGAHVAEMRALVGLAPG